MWVQSPSQEDSPEKEMATHSSILAWEISWAEEADWGWTPDSPWGCKRVEHDLETKQQTQSEDYRKHPFPDTLPSHFKDLFNSSFFY